MRKHQSTILSADYPQSPPNTLKMLNESRAILDIASMPLSFAGTFFTTKAPSASLPIILLPGFASDERYMQPLALYLQRLGFECEDWGLGLNLAGVNLDHRLEDLSDRWAIDLPDGYDPNEYKGEGGVPFLIDQAIEQIQQRSSHFNSPVVLIGWSLGGYIAREVARDLPEQVAQVITMGAPVIGGPKYTKAASFFKAKGLDLDWIEAQVNKRDGRPIQQPITAIVNKRDAIVDWRAAIDKVSPNVEHFEINAAHLGMGFNRKVWRRVVKALIKEQ